MDRKTKIKRDSDSQGHQSDLQIESSGLTAEKKQEFQGYIIWRGKYKKHKRAIEAFITELDSYIPIAKWQLSREPINITSARKHQKTGLAALEKAIYHFEQAYLEMYPSDDPGSAATDLSCYEPTAGLYKLRDMFDEAFASISPGRPSAIKTYIPESPGDFNQMILPDRLQGVIQHIVFLYWRHLGEPTLYSESPLFVIVRKTLELLQWPRENFSRRIKAAIKNLKN